MQHFTGSQFLLVKKCSYQRITVRGGSEKGFLKNISLRVDFTAYCELGKMIT